LPKSNMSSETNETKRKSNDEELDPLGPKAKMPCSEDSDSNDENEDDDNDDDGDENGESLETEHVLEHVADQLRKISEPHRKNHWQHCILKSKSKRLAGILAKQELRDCLSTVSLTCSELEWSDDPTAESLKALKDGISTQLPFPEIVWERKSEQNYLENCLTHQVLAHQEFGKLYKVDQYLKAAVGRFKAVKQIINNHDKAELEVLTEKNHLFELFLDTFRTKFPDPREDILEKVAVYHWLIKANLRELEAFPLV